jgi:type VI secretion system secreted protein Hcp
MDITSAGLARKAISGSSVGTAEIKFVEALTTGGVTNNCVYLYFKLDTAFVKSWSISGDADDRPTEDVALWFNKIGFVYFPTKDGDEFGPGRMCCWDHVKSAPWSGADMPSTVMKVPT